ncbi:MAG: type II toxin-antitoxin system RelE/ParE family toxin [Bacteroidales bacterium]|nr:type II toxin-antitoxin system RelE/ParE family toxin [Bacteroidales bacterium]
MKVFISSNAKLDLYETLQYIADDNPKAVRDWFKDIKDTIKKLSSFHNLGRIVPEYSDDTIREVIKGQYRIVYRININNDTICILAVHHSKRDLP